MVLRLHRGRQAADAEPSRRPTGAVRRNGARQAIQYDAFISYSHAVDGKLAPALQRGLHQLARPWYRMRALHVFRDKTSLSATPGLWPSIQESLEASAYLILLASPEAAASPWVAKEVNWWLAHKTADTLLIALTSGDIRWSESGDFDWDVTTLPSCLRGQFTQEPLWVDLRFARESEHLSLRHGEFRDAVVALAAPLHGRAKDELEGEDVRQHRWTRRLASSAVTLLIVLAVLAVTFAYRAEEQRQIAVSRAMAGQAAALAVGRPDASMLLASGAVDQAATTEAHSALLSTQGQHFAGRLRGHRDMVTAVAFSPDGRFVATGSADHTAALWEWDAHRQRQAGTVRHTKRLNRLAFSPDGRTLATTSDDDTAKLWDVDSRRLVGSLDHEQQDVLGLAFSPIDGRILATTSQDGKVWLWNASDRQRVGTLPNPDGAGVVYDVAFNPADGGVLATASEDGKVRLWDVSHRRLAATLETSGAPGPNYGVAFSRDGRTLAATSSGDNTINLWHWEDNGFRMAGTLAGHTDTTLRLAFSPDGHTLATTSGDNTVKLWEVSGRRLTATLTGHTDTTIGVAFSPDGGTLVTASSDGTAALWDIAKSVLSLRPTGGVFGVAFSPNGRTLAMAGDNGIVMLWDVDHRLPVATLAGEAKHAKDVFGVAFNRDGDRLATVSNDSTVKLWDIAGHRPSAPPLKGHSDDDGLAVAFSRDGILAASGENGTIGLWDAEGRPLPNLPGHEGTVLDLAFSPDGRLLASAGRDKTVKLWEVGPRRLRKALPGHTDVVRGVAFSPDGRVLASAGRDKTVRLWEVARGRPIGRPLSGHTSGVWKVAFSPDGQTLASVGSDHTARLWDVESRRLAATLTGHSSPVHGVAFHRDGRILATASSDGTVRLWDPDVGRVTSKVCRLLEADIEDRWRELLPDFPYRRTCR